MKVNTNLTFYGGAWWATCPNNCGWAIVLESLIDAARAQKIHLVEEHSA